MSKVFLLPIGVFFVYETTFLCTSLAAVLQGHSSSPYISDGGTHSPESCFFSLFSNFGSILLSLVIYIRYRHVEQLMYLNTDLIEHAMNANLLSLWMGLGSCFGLCIVANFQLIHLPTVHYFGAFICFGLGIIFLWTQAYITYDVRAHIGSGRMAYIRFGLAALASYFFFVTIFTNCVFLHKVNLMDKYNVNCEYHHASVLSEWTIATVFNTYILTFATEFKHITFDHPTIVIINRNNFDLKETIEKVSFAWREFRWSIFLFNISWPFKCAISVK